jgi:hypothetical protein
MFKIDFLDLAIFLQPILKKLELVGQVVADRVHSLQESVGSNPGCILCVMAQLIFLGTPQKMFYSKLKYWVWWGAWGEKPFLLIPTYKRKVA